ncbi:uncharacterized protein VTP21DRAFT_3554 [Calcarisporiella thermophila]|uniref:uncharacterized protein n=1 Tax=Calcarisporiella thermophila TaxID=911321 RepID=UPI003742A147
MTEQQEEDFSSLSIPDRIQHKVWKARVSAYDELTKYFRTADPANEREFTQYEPYLKKIVTDSNAVAQENGLSAILSYVENAPRPERSRDAVVPTLVEKCLGSSRAGTRNKAVEILLMYIEVDVADPVVAEVLQGTSAKLPKLVAQAVAALREIVKSFGIKVLDPKPILKSLSKLFAHTDKNVRAEATQLTIELYRWLGAQAINAYLGDLKPVQVKELNEAFEKIPEEKPVPGRILRSQQAAAAEAVAEEGVGEEVQEEAIDPYDLVEAVDISTKIPKDFYEQLASSKWKDRKEALENLLPTCKTPKISNGNYSELISALAKRISDANILVVTLSANCIEGIALGLRNNFGQYKSMVVGPMVEKLKERKTNVVEALANALNATFSSVPFSDIVDDIIAASAHKNPQVRSETIKLLISRLKNIREPPGRDDMKRTTEMLTKCLEDKESSVRDAAAEGLGTMMKIVGERAMAPYLEQVDKISEGKIREFWEKAEVKAKPAVARKAPAPAPASSAAANRSAPVSKPKPKPTLSSQAAVAKEKENAPPSPVPPKPKAMSKPAVKPRVAPPAAKKPAAKPAAAPTAAAKKPPPGKPKDDEPLRFKFSPESAEERATEYFPADAWEDLSQSVWKARLAAMESIYSHLEQLPENGIEAEIVIRCLSKKPGFKETNFQVLSKVFATLQLVAEKSTSFNRACASLAVPGLCDKLGDIKLKKVAGDCLITFAEKTSLQFVLSQVYEPLKKQKSPKVIADSLLWIQNALLDFGIAGLQVRDLIEFLTLQLQSSNASVRTNAVSTLGVLRRFIGPEIKSFVTDVNPTLLATIEAEFEKVGGMEPPQPTRVSTELAAPTAAAAGGANGAGGGAATDPLDDLFPRVDIGSQLNSKLVEECNDANWKIRKAGLENVIAILEGANKRIKPNLGDFAPCLKARLNDSNKVLQLMALEICSTIAAAMGKPFEKYVKTFALPVTACLSDNKANVRGTAISTLESMYSVCGLDQLIGVFTTSLANESPLLRKELLTWLAERLQEIQDKGGKLPDLTPMVQVMFQCLQDRTGDVRKGAQACLPFVVMSAGYDYVMRSTSNLKGASKQTIMPFLEAVRHLGGTSAPSSSSAPSRPKAAEPARRPASSVSPGSSSEEASLPPPPPPSMQQPPPGPRSKLLAPKRGGRGIPAPSARPVSTLSSTSESEESEPTLATAPTRQLRPPGRFGSALGHTSGMTRPSFADRAPATSESDQPAPPSRLQPSASRLRRPRPVQPQDNESEGFASESTGFSEEILSESAASTTTPSVSNAEPMHRVQQWVGQLEQRREFMMDYILAYIASPDIAKSIEVLKQLDTMFQSNPHQVLPYAEPVLDRITNQVRFAFTQLDPTRPSITRLAKHLVNALVLFFSSKELVLALSEEDLQNVLLELAQRVLDKKRLSQLDCGNQLMKALNVTLVKVLDKSDKNKCLRALVTLSIKCCHPPNGHSMPKDSPEAELTELLLKCVWKLTRNMSEYIATDQLKVNEMLRDLNDLFIAISPNEWKQRNVEKGSPDELLMRTFKSIVSELVTTLEDKVYDHLDLIHDPRRSYIYGYLHHTLQTIRKKKVAAATSGMSAALRNEPHSSSAPKSTEPLTVHTQSSTSISRPTSARSFGSDARPLTPSSNGSDVLAGPSSLSLHAERTQGEPTEYPSSTDRREEPIPQALNSPTTSYSSTSSAADSATLNRMLTNISNKLCSGHNTDPGIYELYRFMKQYPHMEPHVNAILGRTTQTFKRMVIHQLELMEQRIARGEVFEIEGSGGEEGEDLTGEDSAGQQADDERPPSGGSKRPSSFGTGRVPDEEIDQRRRLERLQKVFGYQPKSEAPSSETRPLSGEVEQGEERSTGAGAGSVRDSHSTRPYSGEGNYIYNLKERLGVLKSSNSTLAAGASAAAVAHSSDSSSTSGSLNLMSNIPPSSEANEQ